MCIVLNSSHRSRHVNESLQALEIRIKEENMKESVEEVEDSVAFQSLSVSDQYHSNFDRSKTIRHSSPWYEEFAKVVTTTNGLKDVSDHVSNEYYTPGVIELLLKHFLHMFPLWSGVLQGNVQRYSKGGERKVEEVVPNRATNALTSVHRSAGTAVS